jgi:hypothetical protein
MSHDAHTLTDGPTIFITNDVQKMAKYCIQQANVPTSVMTQLAETVGFNNRLSTRIDEIQTQLDLISGTNVDAGHDEGAAERAAERAAARGVSVALTNQTKARMLNEQLDTLVTQLRSPKINDVLVPNTRAHLDIWAPASVQGNPFTSTVGDDMVIQIMQLINVDNSWKLLLLLGIGVLAKNNSTAYTEIMKQLADNQQLYLIIADGDYIHGTNYQYCHGYISKQAGLTQDKIIQAVGRVGRNHLQHTYSIRFRELAYARMMFSHIPANQRPEAVNMNRIMS